ncbi:hypothetical protein PVAG01_10079 [Phlyctema vagabunda]|uniref:Uncharacterized protein n=1 Tax=Phlyctema vagabunda TaxID=108571 RepID=A0ABR4P4X7_9HELO
MLLARQSSRIIRPKQQALSFSTSPLTEPDGLIYPESPNLEHHDLPSFLGYASHVGLNPKSTTYVGTHYEYIVQSSLRQLGMSLKRIGGKSDCGIDLLGTWNIPSAPQPLKVLVQCKALARKIDPAQARELEGAFGGAPPGWRGSGVLGLLVTQKSATKGVREALGRSRCPMAYVLCGSDGKILQMLWNRRAEQEGLEGVGVGLKYGGGDRDDKEVVLTWKGDVIQG